VVLLKDYYNRPGKLYHFVKTANEILCQTATLMICWSIGKILHWYIGIVYEAASARFPMTAPGNRCCNIKVSADDCFYCSCACLVAGCGARRQHEALLSNDCISAKVARIF
jgi:hypothetical protein